jgi:hypothetical protein
MIEWWQTLAQLYPAPVKTYSMPRMATRCVPRSLCYQNEAAGEEIKVPQVGVSCRRAWPQVGDFILCMVINYFTLQWKKFICTYGRSHSILLILPSAACQTWSLLNNQPIKWSLALSIYLGPSSKVHNQCSLDFQYRTPQNHSGMVKVKHNEQLQRYDTFILAYQAEQMYYLSYSYKKLSA